MRFDDATVIVTGGASGIGRATARRLAAEGAAVAALDLDADGADATAEEVRAAGGRALAVRVDVSDDGAVAEAVTTVAEALGTPSGLVTAAGIFHGPDLAPAHLVDAADFLHVVAVNLGGTFSAVRHSLPHLLERGGAIVTIASTAALRGHGHGAGYTASKGGVDALTRLLAVQYGPRGVRANCVCPGGVDTPMTAGVLTTADAQARAEREIPLGRYADADDVAEVVAFLLSDHARYLTGQTVPVEGGAIIA